MSKSLPVSARVPVIRTDYRDDAAWDRLRVALATGGSEGSRGGVDLVEDQGLADLSVEEVLARLPPGLAHPVLFVVDDRALQTPGGAVVVVEPADVAPCQFRAALDQVAAINNNLSLANMDFNDFADSTDPDGVFRGFDEQPDLSFPSVSRRLGTLLPPIAEKTAWVKQRLQGDGAWTRGSYFSAGQVYVGAGAPTVVSLLAAPETWLPAGRLSRRGEFVLPVDDELALVGRPRHSSVAGAAVPARGALHADAGSR